jgi:WXXGXW repeat (2 copies)
MVRRRSTPLLVAASLAGLAACASGNAYHHHDQLVDSQGDVVNERNDQAGRYAHSAPPPDRKETPPPQPGPNYIWQPGHWSFDGNDFQWHEGEWSVPPTGYHTWSPGHWQQSGPNNWMYVEGTWQ